MTLLAKISRARTAGLIYLVVVVTGILSLAYIPSRLIVSGDATRTIENINVSQGLFRLGIAAGFICQLAFLLLPLAFYRLLSHVNKNVAMLMVIFAGISVPISLGNLINKLDVLTLLSGKAYLSNQTTEQLTTAVMLSLARYNNGLLVAEIFWGLWLLPLGYLVFRSGMFPKILGIFLMVGCFGYLVDVFCTTLSSGYSSSILARLATLPASISEIATCLWLVTVGARRQARSVG